MKNVIYILIGLCVFIFSCKEEDDSIENTPIHNTSDIIFHSDSAIYSITSNGKGRSQLTFIDKMGGSPLDYSNTTEKILFASNQGNPINKGELFSMSLNGLGLSQITNNDLSELDFTYSPDGKRISYFGLDGGSQIGSLRIVNSDGTNDQEVTFPPQVAFYQAAPLSWSPNDSIIAFIGHVVDTNSVRRDGIFSININSEIITTILSDSLSPINIKFSPDGSKIGIIGFDDSQGHYNVFIMDSEGNNVEKVTNLSRSSGSNVLTRYISWSIDGDKLVFTTNVNMPASEVNIAGKYFEIYTINTDGSELSRLTNDSIFETSPIWIR